MNIDREVREMMAAMTPAERQGERRARLYEIDQDLHRVMSAQDELKAKEALLRSEKIQVEAALLESHSVSEGQ